MIGSKNVEFINKHSVQTTSLNDSERIEVEKVHGKRIRKDEAARLEAQRAGFHRLRANKKGRMLIGNSSMAAHPLPDEELDGEFWTQASLESAEQALTDSGLHLGKVFTTPEGSSSPIGWAKGLVRAVFMPVAEDVRKLRLIQRSEPVYSPQTSESLSEMTTSMETMFDLTLEASSSMAHRVLVAGLVVAGKADFIKDSDDGMEPLRLTQGIQEVTLQGHKAVERAKAMNQGIDKELSVHRTMVLKK